MGSLVLSPTITRGGALTWACVVVCLVLVNRGDDGSGHGCGDRPGVRPNLFSAHGQCMLPALYTAGSSEKSGPSSFDRNLAARSLPRWDIWGCRQPSMRLWSGVNNNRAKLGKVGRWLVAL